MHFAIDRNIVHHIEDIILTNLLEDSLYADVASSHSVDKEKYVPFTSPKSDDQARNKMIVNHANFSTCHPIWKSEFLSKFSRDTCFEMILYIHREGFVFFLPWYLFEQYFSFLTNHFQMGHGWRLPAQTFPVSGHRGWFRSEFEHPA